MENCGSLFKSVLVTIVLAAVVQSGPAEKLAECCKTVNKQEITEPIIGYLVQKAAPPCVQAVIFQTEKGLFCSQLHARWVRHKISAFEKAKSKATRSSVVSSSTVSLLSIITSTASPLSSSSLPPSSSSSLRSFPSTSKKPAVEIFSENKKE